MQGLMICWNAVTAAARVSALLLSARMCAIGRRRGVLLVLTLFQQERRGFGAGHHDGLRLKQILYELRQAVGRREQFLHQLRLRPALLRLQ